MNNKANHDNASLSESSISELITMQDRFIKNSSNQSRLIENSISSLMSEQHKSVDVVQAKLDSLQAQLISHINAVNNSIVTREIFSRNYITSGSFATQSSILELLRKLRPMRASGFPKIRLGSPHDGGYVMIDDFEGVDTAFSFGIEQNVDWDLQAAERGLNIYQFDGTVDAPPVDNPQFHFEKKMIMPWSSDTTENIEALVSRHDKGLKKPNIILKIDIEHGEWPVFESTTTHTISRFSQIIAEFHGFDYLEDPSWRLRADNVFSKICENFSVVNVHANNHCAFASVANITVPAVMEITFANKNVYDLVETDELFPGPLDTPCDASRPDLMLGSFKF